MAEMPSQRLTPRRQQAPNANGKTTNGVPKPAKRLVAACPMGRTALPTGTLYNSTKDGTGYENPNTTRRQAVIAHPSPSLRDLKTSVAMVAVAANSVSRPTGVSELSA